MKSTAEYMHSIANGFIIVTAGILPLYMQDGLVMLGDAKYTFFIRFAAVFLLLYLAGAAVLAATGKGNALIGEWTVTDGFVAAYGAVSLLSWLFSDYRDVAFLGYVDWHMGLVTQLALVWIYFFLSRFYSGSRYVWMVVLAVSFVVCGIGVLNRYGFDPLGLFWEIAPADWNHINLLSTIGNINWYCGFVCLTLPLPVFLFWQGEGGARVLGLLGSLVWLNTFFTQGSASGYFAILAVLSVLLSFSLRSGKRLLRFVQVLFLVTFTPVFLSATAWVMPRGLILPADEYTYSVIFWKGWYVLAALSGAAAAAGMLFAWKGKGRGDYLENGRAKRIVMFCIMAALVLGAGIIVLCQVSESFWRMLGEKSILRIDDAWGTGRGELWKASLQCFLEGGLKQKLFGAGPDCFGCIVDEMFGESGTLVTMEEWWTAANAHNEWLNMLVTVGAVGAVAYLGIYVSAAVRFWGRTEEQPILILGLLMVTSYGVNNFFSFQQIIVTPEMFLFLGMMEHYCRGGAHEDRRRPRRNAKPHARLRSKKICGIL